MVTRSRVIPWTWEARGEPNSLWGLAEAYRRGTVTGRKNEILSVLRARRAHLRTAHLEHAACCWVAHEGPGQFGYEFPDPSQLARPSSLLAVSVPPSVSKTNAVPGMAIDTGSHPADAILAGVVPVGGVVVPEGGSGSTPARESRQRVLEEAGRVSLTGSGRMEAVEGRALPPGISARAFLPDT